MGNVVEFISVKRDPTPGSGNNKPEEDEIGRERVRK